MKNICIIPARGGSKRFPRKNIAILNGKPLINYTIEAAIDSKLFEIVTVSTDDSEIASVATAAGTVVRRRPLELASDKTRIYEVIFDVIQYYIKKGGNFDAFCLLQPTCPLRNVSDLLNSYEVFITGDVNYVYSISEFQESPFEALSLDNDGYLQFFWDKKYMTGRHNLPQVYRYNGAIIWAKTGIFLGEKEWLTDCGSKAAPYYMPLERSIDIDYPISKKFVEFLLKEEQKDDRSKNR